MFRVEVYKLIENGEISSALKRVKLGFRDKNNSDLSFSLVKHLYQACYDKNSKIQPKTVDDLYELLSILCQHISENWNCDTLKFMQCFYHLNCYMLQQNPLLARKLCQHLYTLKERKGDKSWSHDEIVVVSNLVHNFSSNLSTNFREYLSADGDNSFSSWLDFLFEFFEFFDLNKLYKFFVTLDGILFKVHNSCNDQLKDLIVFYCVKLRKWVEGLILSEKTVECREKDVSAFLSLIDHIVVFLEDNDVLKNFDQIFEVLSKFNLLWSIRPEISTIMNCLKMCSRLEENDVVLDLFDDFWTQFQSMRPESISSVVPLVHRILYKFRIRIAASTLIDFRLPVVIHLMTVVIKSFLKNDDSNQRKAKDLAEIIFCSLFFVKIQRVSKNSLEMIYDDVKMIIKKFVDIDLDYRHPSFSIGVSAVVNAMLAYSWKELHSETNHIAIYCLCSFLKVDSEFLSEDQYFNSYVQTWLTTLASSSVKVCFSLHALSMFVIMASVHPKFAGPAMKAWATVKKANPSGIRMEDTVVDVIKLGGEEIEKKYPKFNVSTVDIDHLLFEEVHAYSKVRELYKGPVLAVYKAAAKTVKDCIALANILCCTVDSFSFDVNDTTYLPYLEDSVRNVITRLQKLKADADMKEPLKSVILCTLGNLFYCKGRIILHRIRQKSEKEASEIEKLNLKGKVPVFLMGEKDDLDITEVTPACSFYHLKNQTEILPVFNEALDYWALASSCLPPHKLLTATLSFVKGTGYILRLYGFKDAELKCWNILYDIALKLNSKNSQILAAAELLVVTSSVDSTILSNADNLLQQIGSNKRNRTNYVHQLYRVHLAKNLLLRGKIDECWEIIKAVDVSTVSRFLVKAQFSIVLALLNILNPAKQESFNEAPISPIVHNFEGILYLVQNNQWDTFNEATVVQLLMFEVATLLVVLFSDVKVIRSARCYIKVDLNLVKRLALPSRVCQLMSLRIWVDLLTWNVAECDLNAQELESMLDLGVLKEDVQIASEKPGSPRLLACSVKCVPHFLLSDDCNCYLCNDSHYSGLALNAITLRILISIGSEDHHLAAVVIRVGLSVIEKIKGKTSPYSMFWEPFACPIARFYYVVANYKFLRKNYQQAIHYSAAALESLTNEPVVNEGLLCSIKRLQTAINSSQNYVRPKRDKLVSRRFGVEVDGNKPVTPEHLKYNDDKPWVSTINMGKTIEKGYFSRGKSYVQKSLFNNDQCDNKTKIELDNDTPPSTNVVNGKPKGKKAVASSLFATPRVKSGTDGRRFFSKTADSGLTNDDVVSLDSNDTVIELGATPSTTTANNKISNKSKTRLKLGFGPSNAFGTPVSLGLSSKLEPKTPAIKVFYDPEGVECQSSRKTGKNGSTTSTVKRQLERLPKGKSRELKFETPRKPRVGQNQFKLDDLDDEWQSSTSSARKLKKNTKEKVDSDIPSIVVSSFEPKQKTLSNGVEQLMDSSEAVGTVCGSGMSVIDSDTDDSIVETTPPRTLRKRPIPATPTLQLVSDLQKLSLSTKTPQRPTRSRK